jgi:ubiquinone/menaquinone biosynthesis C-methylase UbiE
MSIAGRFSERAESYSRFRWEYASEAINAVIEECGLSERSVVADIGSGTGMLTRHFEGRVVKILAVEPSAGMRAIAAHRLTGKVEHIHGVADATTLADNSVDMITVGRALHWFPAASSRLEFRRIVKQNGWLAIFRVPCTDQSIVAELKSVRTEENGWDTTHEETRNQLAPLSFFFGHEDLRTLTFPRSVRESWTDFLGRICSFAPAPKFDHPLRPKLERVLRDIFERRAVNGFLELPIATEVTLGRLQKMPDLEQ